MAKGDAEKIEALRTALLTLSERFLDLVAEVHVVSSVLAKEGILPEGRRRELVEQIQRRYQQELKALEEQQQGDLDARIRSLLEAFEGEPQ